MDLKTLWEISDKNLERLREVFDIPESSDSASDNPFDRLKGILQDCSDGADSIELVRSVRER